MPGRIFPADEPRTEHSSEVAIYKALAAQLPDDWVAWHSLSIRTQDGRYGEGDFIIAAPEWGFLVLEVKGGEVYERNGHWYQNRKRLRQGPLAQAHAYRSKFHSELRRVYDRYEVEGKCAVCLPHVAAENRPTNSDYRDILIDKSQLGDLVSCLRRAFECQFTRGNAPPNTEWIDRIHDLWGDNWQPRVGLMGQARLRGMERESLNALQLGVLEGLVENQNVLVSGAAGTGKTTVATQLAINWAYEGKSVRYLCFTEALAHWLNRRFKAEFEYYDADIKAVAVRARAEFLARRWELEIEGERGTNTYWADLMGKVVLELADRTTDRPEIVIVDEAQCFDSGDWQVVDHLRTLLGRTWIFQDKNQSFWAERELPDSVTKGHFTKYKLPKQERMPSAIQALAFAYVSGASPDEALRKFEPSLIRVVDCLEDPSDALAAELDNLIEMGFRPQQIAVATMCGMSKSRLWSQESVGSHRLVHAQEDEAQEHVVLDTFLRLQGLDRDVILICEGDADAAAYNYETRMHQAITRASAGVVILAGPGLWERDAVLSALRAAGKLDDVVDPAV